MSQTGVVTRLALRELWISYRLLLLLAAYVGAGAFVALVPAPVPALLERVAAGLAAATLVGSALAARSISVERALGRAGWLVGRSIGRGTLLVAWFLALSLVSLLGIGAAGILAWLAITSASATFGVAAFGAVLSGVAATTLAALAGGLLLGSVLRPAVATVGAVAVCLAAGAGLWLFGTEAWLPLAALVELPHLSRPISIGIRGAGAGLAAAATLLVVARITFARMDL